MFPSIEYSIEDDEARRRAAWLVSAGLGTKQGRRWIVLVVVVLPVGFLLLLDAGNGSLLLIAGAAAGAIGYVVWRTLRHTTEYLRTDGPVRLEARPDLLHIRTAQSSVSIPWSELDERVVGPDLILLAFRAPTLKLMVPRDRVDPAFIAAVPPPAPHSVATETGPSQRYLVTVAVLLFLAFGLMFYNRLNPAPCRLGIPQASEGGVVVVDRGSNGNVIARDTATGATTVFEPSC